MPSIWTRSKSFIVWEWVKLRKPTRVKMKAKCFSKTRNNVNLKHVITHKKLHQRKKSRNNVFKNT